MRPPLHLGVVAIEKRNFWWPSTTVANFTYLVNVIARLDFELAYYDSVVKQVNHYTTVKLSLFVSVITEEKQITTEYFKI